MRFSLLLFIFGIFLQSFQAQSVVVKLLNGKNGKPLSKFRVYVILDDPKNQQPLDFTTDREGEVRFEIKNAKTFQIRPIGVVACGEQRMGVPVRDYLVDDLLKRGLVTINDCGNATVEPLKGQFTYFVRPATWWELFRL